MTNNAINNTVANNDFSVNRSVAATPCVHSVTHSDDTNTASNAVAKVQVGGTSGGDAFARLSVTGGQDYSIGIDNTDSDALKITDDANPSTGNVLWKMTSAGERTLPLNSAFNYNAVLQSNVTGDGTAYDAQFTTSRFNIGSDYDGTSEYTAPVDGLYMFCVEEKAKQAGASNDYRTLWYGTFPTSADFGIIFGPNILDNLSEYNISSTFFAYFDAGDTIKTTFQGINGTKVMDLDASSNFCGALIS